MNETPEEILNRFKPNREYPSYYHESDIIEAMEIHAKQEAFAFANWISNQPIQGRTITKLWNDYQDGFKEAL